MERIESNESNERNLQWGQILRTKLYQLVQDGYYDMVDKNSPSVEGMPEDVIEDVLQPFVCIQYELDDMTLVYCNAAATEELGNAYGTFSRNFFKIEIPLDYDEHGQLKTVRYLHLMLDETTGKIGLVERDIYGFGKYHKRTPYLRRLSRLEEAGNFKDAHRLRVEIGRFVDEFEDSNLSEEEFVEVLGILARIDTKKHAQKPAHLSRNNYR